MNENVLLITIYEPDGVVFDGDVDMISSYNELGIFDIMPEHENFICIIKKELIITIGKQEKKYPLERGVLKIAHNKAEVFIGI